MPVLTNLEHAEIDIVKLRDYCLSVTHLRGRHKARLFASALGIEAHDGSWLRDALLQGLRTHEALQDAVDRFGTRWKVDMMVTRHGRRAVIRTIWLIPSDTGNPRLVTAWVL